MEFLSNLFQAVTWASLVRFILGDGLGAALTLLPLVIVGMLIWKHFDAKHYPSFRLSWRDIKDVMILAMCLLSMIAGLSILVLSHIGERREAAAEAARIERVQALPWYKMIHP